MSTVLLLAATVISLARAATMATLATCLISAMKTKEKEIEVLDEARLLVEVAED